MAAAPSAIKERIEELRAALHRHNHNYYILNAPEISDQKFDALMKEICPRCPRTPYDVIGQHLFNRRGR